MIIDPNTGEVLDSPSPFGRCIFCGQITQEWWYLDRRNGNDCRCQSCYSLGRAHILKEIWRHEIVNKNFRAHRDLLHPPLID